MAKPLLTPGLTSTVYAPIILRIFRNNYKPGVQHIDFSLKDVRDAARAIGVLDDMRNAADVIYRMRARTFLPKEIRDAGFNILRSTGRGLYRLQLGNNVIVDLEDSPTIIDAIDTTPLPVRRLLPENLGEIDEQGLLAVVGYCQLLNHFTGLTVYRLRNHVRKSVDGVGQAEVDAVDVGVALSDEEIPIIFPIEAKASADAINLVQISTHVQYARQYFNGYVVRPLAIKVDGNGLIHFVEFADQISADLLSIVKRSTYRLNLSDRQLSFIRQTPTKVTP